MHKVRITGKSHRECEGFTLVELLICVLILGMIAVPFFNSFIVAQRTNSKAKEIQRATNLAQNIMETIKSKTIQEIKAAFASSNIPVDLNLLSPYDCSSSIVQVVREDQVAGSYEFSMKSVKDGSVSYDVFVSLEASPFKIAAVGVQNNYRMPEITSLKGERVAVINPEENFTGWITTDGGVTYTKDMNSTLDNTVLEYYYNLHLAYIDQLIMHNQAVADSENANREAIGLSPNVLPDPLPPYYPYSKSDIKGFIQREVQIVEENDYDSMGSPDYQKVKLVGKIIYRIPSKPDPAKNITADTADLTSEYQIFSKNYHSTDGSNPLEQIYLFYEKPLHGMGEDMITLKNQSINPATVNLVLQSTQPVKVKYVDPSFGWELVSNDASKITLVGSLTGTGVSSDLIKEQAATDRLFTVSIDVYEHNNVDRGGKKITSLSSTKEE